MIVRFGPRAAVAVVAAVILAGACTSQRAAPPAPAPISPGPSASAVPVGDVTTTAARRALCPRAEPGAGGSFDPGPTPVSLRAVRSEVARIRGLPFLEPVPVVRASRAEVADALRAELDRAAPGGFLERRTRVYRTIGLIDDDVSLREALASFLTAQVYGYYVPETGQLVVVSGAGDLDALGEATLAHELTHALDDQHFDLDAIAELGARCADDRMQAMLGAVEGSAQRTMTSYVAENLDLAELGSLALEQQQAASLDGVPPFVIRSELWPYTAGQAFVTELAGEGGEAAIDRVLRDPPVSTEQVLHPERYPDDLPQRVEVPDLAPALGESWADLDVETTGEAWLATMLALRLDRERADDAAAGWDGGVLRSWGRGGDVVSVLRTVWDAPSDAATFTEAIAAWVEAGDVNAELIREPSGAVSVVFASPGAVDPAAEAARSLRAWAA